MCGSLLRCSTHSITSKRDVPARSIYLA
ncbi:MAG: hypothetical protein CL946_00145 [Ectothiorhodospiraceae bacterium]|nr:hypothetical protein [Ectothiorhodospiraceae bacterium]